MNIYNPYRAAVAAAFSELSSPAAKRYYINRAQADIQTAFVLIVQFGCMAYALGAAARQFVDPLSPATSEPASSLSPATPSPKLLPAAAAPIALLPPARDRVLVTAAVLPSSGTVIVPPVDALAIRLIASTERMNMEVRELRQVAKQNGLKGYSRMSKTMLQALLAV